jgi:ubiquitin-conjugating enzyme E2 J2
MASDICVRRLTKELAALKKEPIQKPRITVAPNEKNILEMHYVIEGSEGTPYEGGVYHGKLLFPKEYPLKPPGVMMLTPSGRFVPNRRLCLSMSDFHPESWNPMWSVSTILTGLYSFMIEKNPTLGSIETTTKTKRKLAADSLEYNVKRDQQFCKLFPEYVQRYEEEVRRRLEQQGTDGAAAASAAVVESSPQTMVRAGDLQIPQAFRTTIAGLLAVFSIVMAVRFLYFL